MKINSLKPAGMRLRQKRLSRIPQRFLIVNRGQANSSSTTGLKFLRLL
jgi:hypothetical protein